MRVAVVWDGNRQQCRGLGLVEAFKNSKSRPVSPWIEQRSLSACHSKSCDRPAR
jgi:hypothetical protein